MTKPLEISREDLEPWVTAILVLCALGVAATVLYGMVEGYVATWLTVTATIGCPLIWIVVCICSLDTSLSRKTVRTWAGVSLSLSSLALIVIPFPKEDGFWLNPRNGETTLSESFFVVAPIVSGVVWIPGQTGVSTQTKLMSADGIPLSCHVSAGGIMLDPEKQDLAALTYHRIVLDGMHPVDYIHGELSKVLAERMQAVMAGMPSDRIAAHERFYIPYHLGTPVAATLKRLHYRWSDGAVSASCRVVFN